MLYKKPLSYFRILLKYGAKTEAVDKIGRTPLYFAAKSENYMDVVTLVEEGGADIYKRAQDGKAPFNVSKSSDILKFFFTKMTPERLKQVDKKLELYEEILEKHPALIDSFLDIFIESTNNDLDAPDNSVRYDLSLFVTGNSRDRKKFNMMHRHMKLIKAGRSDALLHPVMASFTNIKWMQYLKLFIVMMFFVFLFIAFFSWHIWIYVGITQCEPYEPQISCPVSTSEEVCCKKDEPADQVCGKVLGGVYICNDTDLGQNCLTEIANASPINNDKICTGLIDKCRYLD